MNKKIITGSRILLGLLFTVFGLNGFLQFLPMPPPPAAGGAYLGALFATGYFFPVLAGVELITGVLLLLNRFVPLALILLAPVVVQINLYHGFLDPAGMGLPLVITFLGVFLAYSYRESFKAVLNSKAQPTVSSASVVRVEREAV